MCKLLRRSMIFRCHSLILGVYFFFLSDFTIFFLYREGSDQKLYPAMTHEEIEEWLGHIPVFTVTDKKGMVVVMRPDNNTSISYFFMSPVMANATLAQLQAAGAENMELQISAFSLGKLWFTIFKANSTDEGVKVKSPNSMENDEEGNEIVKGVEYRLVPDTRDLFGARMLLTMGEEENKALKDAGSITPEIAQAAIKKAMTSSPKFNRTYNEVPVFVIQQMRLVKQPVEGEKTENKEPETMLPMYFNLQTMVSTWQKFTSQSPETTGMEPAINLMDLSELVDLMQQESTVDWRKVILMPQTNVLTEPSAADVTSVGGTQSQIPGMGQTLGDL